MISFYADRYNELTKGRSKAYDLQDRRKSPLSINHEESKQKKQLNDRTKMNRPGVRYK